MSAKPSQRLVSLTSQLAQHYGLSLKSIAPVFVDALLAELPDEIDFNDDHVKAKIHQYCCIGETTFLRHREHFDLFLQHLQQYKDKSQSLKIWSAGCCTGEEAYSLAALLLDSGYKNFKVIATDINERFIRKAQIGRYTNWSLRGVSKENTKWLESRDDEVIVRPELRDKIEFAVQNLATEAPNEVFDVIFCRNVLMYFTKANAQQVLSRFYQLTTDNAPLFLGYFDPIPETAQWTRLNHEHTQYYVRVNPEESQSTSADQDADQLDTKRTVRPTELNLVRRPSKSKPVDSPSPELVVTGAQSKSLLTRDNEKQEVDKDHKAVWEAAKDLKAQIVENPLTAKLHLALALKYQALGESLLQLEAARKAAFIEPEESMPHYLLGDAYRLLGRSRQSHKHWQLAKRYAEGLEHHQKVKFGSGLTTSQLLELIDGERR